MNSFNSRQSGFTLIEIMIVVVIIGILAAFAYPNYQEYILRSHRVDARNMLQEAAQRMEQNYAANHSYATDGSGAAINNASLGTWGLARSPATSTVRYNLSFSIAPDATSYTLQAVPTGPQSGDRCATLTLASTNVKTANGQGPRARISRECWSR